MSDNKPNVPKLRFPGFTDPWEQRKVGDLFRITRGQVLASDKTRFSKSSNSPYPVYSSQTKNDGLMGYYEDYLFESAITWTTDGANAGTVNFRKGRFYCTNVCGVLISDRGYANTAIALALGRLTKKYVSHVGNPKLMNNVMAQISFSVPPSQKEQNNISNLFDTLDNLITLHLREPSISLTLNKVQMRLVSERITRSMSLFSSSLMM